MAKVLVLCSRVPYPLTDGSRIRMYHTARGIARQHTVDLLIIDDDPDREGIDHLRSRFNNVEVFNQPTWRKYKNSTCGIFSQRPIQTHYYWHPKAANWIARKKTNYDLIWGNHVRTTEYIRKTDPECPVVIDLVDAISRNYTNAVDDASGLWRFIYSLEAPRLLNYEAKVIDDVSDLTFLISSPDHEFIANRRQLDGSVSILPNGVPQDYLETPLSTSESSSEIVFIGKMNYQPNVDAVHYFSNEIFPRIRERHSDTRFSIVGKNPEDSVQELDKRDNITVTGFVDDPSEYLQRASVAVAPMRHGAGIQNKVLEAMAIGTPVVTTSLGAEGISAGHDELAIADTPADFAEVITDLLNDPSLRHQQALAAREVVHSKYCWPSILDKLNKEIDELIGEYMGGGR